MNRYESALAYGPNINLPMDPEAGTAAYEAIQRAQAAARHVGPREQALIEALATRYEPVPREERAALDSAYARALRQVVERFPDDVEARTLYAEALMTLSPWEYWNRDGSPRPDTPELLEQLERVLAANPDHPGANHFYIHAVEEIDPQRAVPMAERLAGLMPGAGHLVHMPGHIYLRVGRYADAIRANEHAVRVDETYIQDQNPAFGVYTAGYYPHNYDFLAFAASMIGRSAQAIGAAERMTTLSPDELLYAPGMTFVQHHRPRRKACRTRGPCGTTRTAGHWPPAAIRAKQRPTWPGYVPRRWTPRWPGCRSSSTRRAGCWVWRSTCWLATSPRRSVTSTAPWSISALPHGPRTT
jgi:tetratricopeptide (TPR) repeat protein